MKLYLPTSSRNFSLIFETESISPEIFYTQRNFGNTRYRICPLDLTKEYITLYSVAPIFHSDDNENYPMWLEFDIEDLSKNIKDLSLFLPNLEKDKVFLYPQTIYFDSFRFRCIFLSERDKKNTIIDSESYRTVKARKKYNLTTEPPDFFKSLNIPDEKVILTNELSAFEIEKDRRFNHFKGFLFGYAIGELKKNVSPERTALDKLIDEIHSTFTNAKSQIILRRSEQSERKNSSYKSKWEYTPPPYSLADAVKELTGLCDYADSVYLKLRANTTSTDDKILEMAKSIFELLKQENADFATIDESKAFIKTLEIRRQPLAKAKKALSAFFNVVDSRHGSISDDADYFERAFKNALIQVKNEAHRLVEANTQVKEFDVNRFEIENSQSVKVNRSLLSLNSAEEYLLFEIIVEQLLKFPRVKTSEITREDKLTIVESLGRKVSLHPPLNKREYLDELRKFYFALKRYESYRIESMSSIVLQNYACFLTKIDRLDELITFSESRTPINNQLAISFWGAYNGFAEIDSRNSDLIFSPKNLALANSFDNYLKHLLRVLDRETFERQVIEDVSLANWVDSEKQNITSEVDKHDQEKQSSGVVQSYLKHLQLEIWRLPTIKNFNDTQKEDVSEGLNDITEQFERELHNEMGTFVDNNYINKRLIQAIQIYNKKKKKERI